LLTPCRDDCRSRDNAVNSGQPATAKLDGKTIKITDVVVQEVP